MTRFLTGIIAVALVQIAFVIYLAADRQDEAVSKAAAEARPVFDRTMDPALAMIADSDPMPTGHSTRRSTEPLTATYGQKEFSQSGQAFVKTSRRKSPVEIYRAETVAFRKPPRVVFSDPYAGKPSSERRTERSASVKETAQTEKRSFIAKVLPVVKKPYDWLKAVASKLR